MSEASFVVDVYHHPGIESVEGYPKRANNEVRAHAIAEQVARELQCSGNPGEYLVTVCIDQTLVATQVVLVPAS
ncbi:MAG TPA: hypothetical protein VNX88_03970 [Terriglobales bacterium]|jgi:hypothetical protein|nr:hypothetical protein [Terriglobales bacterium]